MADIFISYSSKDREKAEQLIELLASAGLSVWIDKSGIDVATSWSKEIVQAIDSCKALVVLLSPNSVVSVNVAKEVSLAAEQKKKILPLDIEPVELTDDLRYHLAGIQRAPMTNIDSIIRALGKLGLEATQSPTLKLVKETDGRKSLMILPFEDLSPTADNGWFADGIVSELINALSNVKAIRTMDATTTKEYKSYKGHLTVYAKEMGIRYFVQGDVRKFGDQIKISSRLLDIETGDHLWQESLKGTMEDIFDIQEKVAENVAAGLMIHLHQGLKEHSVVRMTHNVEAYELYFRATQYGDLGTKEGRQQSIRLVREVIRIAPEFAKAYLVLANNLAQMYRYYDRDPSFISEADTCVQKAIEIEPTHYFSLGLMGYIRMLQGRIEEAEKYILQFVALAPEDRQSHYGLGLFYIETGQPEKAIAPCEESVRRVPDSLPGYYNLVIAYERVGNQEGVAHTAKRSLPYYTRYVYLFPDNIRMQIQCAVMLFYAGEIEKAKHIIEANKNVTDPGMAYTVACISSVMGLHDIAMSSLKSAYVGGYPNIREIITDHDFDSLRERDDFNKLIEELKAKHG